MICLINNEEIKKINLTNSGIYHYIINIGLITINPCSITNHSVTESADDKRHVSLGDWFKFKYTKLTLSHLAPRHLAEFQDVDLYSLRQK